MKKFYLFLLFGLFSIFQVKAFDFFEGYIITKNGIRLTGMIGTLDQTRDNSSVIFINDFGNIYQIYPELISGFVFQQDTAAILFESKVEKYEKRWVFMQVLCKGKGFNLYTSVSERTASLIAPYDSETRAFKTSDYYLDTPKRVPFKIRRIGFRKQMKRLLNRRAPKLADLIGKKGYRYKDLVDIINAYNDIVSKSKKYL